MFKWIAALAAFAVAFVMIADSASASAAPRARAAKPQAERPRLFIGPFDVGDPHVFAGGTIAGLSMTGTYLAIEKKRGLHFGSGRPRGGSINGGAFALTTVGCMTLSPMLASAIVYAKQGRMLTQREALGLGVDCIIPFVGSMLWNAAYDAHPEWPGR